jgi:hypothetical protein
MQLTFEWHDSKAIENFRKHQVTFEEAKTVFNDPILSPSLMPYIPQLNLVMWILNIQLLADY